MSHPPTPTPPPLFNDDDSDSDANQLIPNASSQRQVSEVPMPKTPNRVLSRSATVTPRSHSRRTTPRSNTRHSTPGRGSVRRNPSTPYTLRAMEHVSATTPVRNVRRETRRYSPKDDLRYLSRLLVRERDNLTRRQQQQSLYKTIEEQEIIETVSPASLAPPLIISSSQQQHDSTIRDDITIKVAELNRSRLSEQHHTTTLSELDEAQRRLSERFSFPTNNIPSDLFNDLAVPEAVIDDQAQFDNENFGYDNDEFANLQGPHFTSDDDDLDNDLVYSDEYDFSLLKDQAKVTFRPTTASSQTLKIRKPLDGQLKIPLSLLRTISRQALSRIQHDEAKIFKQKQFSKNMLLHLQEISDEFLTQQMDDLSAFAKHANRKTINTDDFAILTKRHKDINIDDFQFEDLIRMEQQNQQTKNTELFCLADNFCNLSELREIEENLYKNELNALKKKQRKKRKIQVKDESDEGIIDDALK